MIVVHHPSCGALEGGGVGGSLPFGLSPKFCKIRGGGTGVEGSVNLKPELFAYFV